MAENSDSGDEYLVRGAQLRCDCGTHPRRVNLPLDHGVIIDTEDGYSHPFIHEKDCIVGPTGNIDYFGICTKGGSGDSIVLQEVDAEGKLTGAVIQGTKCMPVFPSGKWNDTKQDVRLGGVYGEKIVTSKSCLMCALGGKITPESSGVEYKGEQDG